MLKSIEVDGFKRVEKSPMNAMIKDAEEAVEIIHRVFNVNKFKLHVSNPSVPLMYGLPNVRKAGEKMRKIVSNVNSPLTYIIKWLVNDLN